MLSFFKGLFPEPVKKKKCIRIVKKDDGFFLTEGSCGEDIWPEPETENVNGNNAIVYYCSKHREHKYTEDEYNSIAFPK